MTTRCLAVVTHLPMACGLEQSAEWQADLSQSLLTSPAASNMMSLYDLRFETRSRDAPSQRDWHNHAGGAKMVMVALKMDPTGWPPDNPSPIQPA